MKDKCFDIGVIQTFVDGELSAGLVEKLVKHVSICDACAGLVAELESENEFAFGALDSDLNVLVPTERLRNKVFASIEESEKEGSKGFWASVSGIFDLGALAFRPGLTAFAGIFLLVAFSAVGLRLLNTSDESTGSELVAGVNQENAEIAVSDSGPLLVPGGETTDNSGAVNVVDEGPTQNSAGSEGINVVKAVQETRRPRRPVNNAVRAENAVVISPARSLPSVELDDEDGYLRTIATLSRTVDDNKDFVLRPRERVAYERDLAIVNDAIKKMKSEVRQNPGNSAAREVLRSSYKNKIDLLSSVADRAEMVASLD